MLRRAEKREDGENLFKGLGLTLGNIKATYFQMTYCHYPPPPEIMFVILGRSPKEPPFTSQFITRRFVNVIQFSKKLTSSKIRNVFLFIKSKTC